MKDDSEFISISNYKNNREVELARSNVMGLITKLQSLDGLAVCKKEALDLSSLCLAPVLPKEACDRLLSFVIESAQDNFELLGEIPGLEARIWSEFSRINNSMHIVKIYNSLSCNGQTGKLNRVIFLIYDFISQQLSVSLPKPESELENN